MRVPRCGPLEGKHLYLACLILYCWHSWSYYNGGVDKIWLWSKKRRVLAYARGGDGICARLDVACASLAAPPCPYMGDEVSGSGLSRLQVYAKPNYSWASSVHLVLGL
jgi:hypothetical protein